MPPTTLLPLTQPVADLALTYTLDPATGEVVVDFPLTPAGDLQLVAGTARLAQDVARWLVMAQGDNVFDPTYGNPLYALIGRPAPQDQVTMATAMIQQAQASFLSRQQQEIRAGTRSASEAVVAFTNIQVQQGVLSPTGTLQVVPGALTVSFDIQTQDGTVTPVSIPLAF